MSFAPRDSHEAQVQFALERGVPAVIGVLGTIRLPYPSGAFDMAHCSRCLIPWDGNGEYILVENVHCSFIHNQHDYMSTRDKYLDFLNIMIYRWDVFDGGG